MTTQLAVACELAIEVALSQHLTALRFEGLSDIADVELWRGSALERVVQVKSRGGSATHSAADVAEMVRRFSEIDAESFSLVTDSVVSSTARVQILAPGHALAAGVALTERQEADLERHGLGQYFDALGRFSVRERWGDPQHRLDRARIALQDGFGTHLIGADEVLRRTTALRDLLLNLGDRSDPAERIVDVGALRRCLGLVQTQPASSRISASVGELVELPAPDRTLLARETLTADAVGALAQSEPVTIVLCGLPGCGKTELAIELADRVKGEFALVWWLDAQRSDSLSEGLRRMLLRLEVSGATHADATQITSLARNELMKRGRCLLVLDNIDAPGALRATGLSGSAHLLLTSRHPRWAAWEHVYEVQPFTSEEAVSLLARHRPQENTDALDKLGSALGYLPLAVAQAGHCLDHTPRTVAAFTSLVERALDILDDEQAAADAEGRYGQTVVVMLRLLLDRFDDSPTRDLAGLIAQFGPEPIPFQMLRRATESSAQMRGLEDELTFERGLAQLDRAAIIRLGAEGAVMHRLTARGAREQLADDENHRIGVAALLGVDSTFPTDVLQTSGWAAAARVLPHAHALLAQDTLLATERGGRLALRVCALDHLQGRFEETTLLARRALALTTPDSPRDLPAALLHTLGRVSMKQGDSEASLGPLLASLSLLSDAGLSDSLEYAVVETTLGAALTDLQGDDATGYLEHALRVYRAKLTSGDKRFARAMLELALDREAKRDPRAAESLTREALRLVDRPDADAGVDLARALSNLAAILLDHFPEKHAEAIAVAERALGVTRNLYGPTSPEVAYPLTALGALLVAERPIDALAVHEEALRIREAAFGSHHVQIAYSLSHIGETLIACGDGGRAVVFLRQARQLLIDLLDDDHFEVASTSVSLGIALASVGRQTEARRLITDGAELLRSSLGRNAPQARRAEQALRDLNTPRAG